MKTLSLCSQYIYTMPLYTVNNKHLYTTNMEIHNFSTIYNTSLHPPISNLTKLQKGAYHSGIKIFSHLPVNTKCLMNDLEHFPIAPERFLNSISLEEFPKCNRQPHMFCIRLLSIGSFIDLSPQFIITTTRIRKSHSWLLLYGCLMLSR